MEILGIGYQEILLIAALLVIVVGPRRMPEMAYYIGRAIKKLQGYARVVRDEFSEEFAYLNEEMEAVRADMQEVRTSVTEVRDELAEVRGEVVEAGTEVRDEAQEATASLTGSAAAPADANANATPAPARNGSAPDAPPATATAATEAPEVDVNGTEPVRGVPGPSYMPTIATLPPREPDAASPAPDDAPGDTETGAEAEQEPEAPAKPLVF